MTRVSSSRPASSTCTRICANRATRMPRPSRRGLAAAAHGGFTTVCAMPNTTPAARRAGRARRDPRRRRRVRVAGRAAGVRRGDGRSGRGDAGGARRARRCRGRRLLRRRRAGPVGRRSCATRWPTPGPLGLPVVDHPEDATQTEGAEANDGFVATVLGLRGWPAAAEEAAVARDLAVLGEVVRDVPGRPAAPHPRLDGRIAGARPARRRRPACRSPATSRRITWRSPTSGSPVRGGLPGRPATDGDPWRDEAIVGGALRVVAPGQPAAARAGDALACLAAPRRRHGRCHRHRPCAAHRGRQGRRVRAGGERDQRHRDGARAGPGSGRRRASSR